MAKRKKAKGMFFMNTSQKKQKIDDFTKNNLSCIREVLSKSKIGNRKAKILKIKNIVTENKSNEL